MTLPLGSAPAWLPNAKPVYRGSCHRKRGCRHQRNRRYPPQTTAALTTNRHRNRRYRSGSRQVFGFRPRSPEPPGTAKAGVKRARATESRRPAPGRDYWRAGLRGFALATSSTAMPPVPARRGSSVRPHPAPPESRRRARARSAFHQSPASSTTGCRTGRHR